MTQTDNQAEKNLIQEIIALEWKMFTHVENRGGRAACQTRPDTFSIMRGAQMATWSTEVMKAYLNDLLSAESSGRNLCAEKYGYMMEHAVPKEFAEIKHLIPELGEEQRGLIKELVAANLEWEAEVDQRYSKLRAHGRPLRKEADEANQTSVETYLLGELSTYSVETLRILWEYTLYCKKIGRNLAMENLKNIVLAYGFDSIDDAEGLL